MLSEPLQIGALRASSRAFLAPLAGVSDVPFRRICTRLGAGLTYTEMLPAHAIMRGNPRTARTLQRHPEEPLVGVQLTGPSAEDVAAAVRRVASLDFDTIDINMGCPVRKIVGSGCGAAVLLDPERVTRTVQLARESTTKPLSVKIRLGYRRDAVNVEEITGRAAEAGADMITIHGRTREDRYGVVADWQAVRAGAVRARERSGGRTLIVANGDALGPSSAREMMRVTACDAAMIARGALGNPWIFRDLLSPTPIPLTAAEWLDTVFQHIDWHEAFYDHNPLAAPQFRKHLLWYAQGFVGSRRLKDRLLLLSSFDEVRAELRAFVAGLPADAVRQSGFEYHLNQDE